MDRLALWARSFLDAASSVSFLRSSSVAVVVHVDDPSAVDHPSKTMTAAEAGMDAGLAGIVDGSWAYASSSGQRHSEKQSVS